MRWSTSILWASATATLVGWLLNFGEGTLTAITAVVILAILRELGRSTDRISKWLPKVRVTICCAMSVLTVILNLHLVRGRMPFLIAIVALFAGVAVLAGSEIWSQRAGRINRGQEAVGR